MFSRPEGSEGSPPTDYALRRVDLGTPDYDRTLDLRERVLLRPFGISLERATTDDAAATHFALFEETSGDCVACLLLVPRDGPSLQMRQVAVASERQRAGLGRGLVLGAEDWARGEGAERLFAHARETAIPFYVALGYAITSAPFEQVGLPHRTVEKRLS